ncbi:hypothetical protein ACFLT9_08325, partial [Acidobacteriota bacterium]
DQKKPAKSQKKEALPKIGTIEGEISTQEAEGDATFQIVEVVKPQPKPIEPVAVAAPVQPKKKGTKPTRIAPHPVAADPESKPTKPKKEAKKKTKIKMESEKLPRRKKGAKRIREEELELEESELEALFAIKSGAQQDIIEPKAEEPEEKKEKDGKKEKEEYKEFVKEEEPPSGIFASKLKSALTESKIEMQEKKKAKKRRRR